MNLTSGETSQQLSFFIDILHIHPFFLTKVAHVRWKWAVANLQSAWVCVVFDILSSKGSVRWLNAWLFWALWMWGFVFLRSVISTDRQACDLGSEGGLSCPHACYKCRKTHTGDAFILLRANFKRGKLLHMYFSNDRVCSGTDKSMNVKYNLFTLISKKNENVLSLEDQ